MADQTKLLTTIVTANTELVDYEVIPNGDTWHIDRIIGSASPFRDSHIRLVWDYGSGNEDILAIVYGSFSIIIERDLLGNGVKKLALILENDSPSSVYFYAKYLAASI